MVGITHKTRRTAWGGHAAVLLLCALLGLAGCRSHLPVYVEDLRVQKNNLTVVDVYGICGERERQRTEVTPVDEYFATLGRPSRPQHVWRCSVDALPPAALTTADANYRAWRQAGADTLVAVTPRPKRPFTTGPDERRVFFSPSAADYPTGTRSIALKLNEHGLRAEPSTRIIPNPVP